MLRFRMVGRSGRIFRKPMYQVEESLAGSSAWAPVGELDGLRVSQLMDPNDFAREHSSALALAFRAFKAGDTRWVYPGHGLLNKPPSE